MVSDIIQVQGKAVHQCVCLSITKVTLNVRSMTVSTKTVSTDKPTTSQPARRRFPHADHEKAIALEYRTMGVGEYAMAFASHWGQMPQDERSQTTRIRDSNAHTQYKCTMHPDKSTCRCDDTIGDGSLGFPSLTETEGIATMGERRKRFSKVSRIRRDTQKAENEQRDGLLRGIPHGNIGHTVQYRINYVYMTRCCCVAVHLHVAAQRRRRPRRPVANATVANADHQCAIRYGYPT